ncbi:GNAT family protein [Pilimelia columellifera]|uniref:GNAT family protein n=1 Tax=Pilimelia columellifera subsp. columellifera TaxID=706583 RepID=A0ABN3NHR3_9ACTN
MHSVRLRPIAEGDLTAFETAFQRPDGAGVHQWFGYWTAHRFRDNLQKRGLLAGPENMLAIEVDGDLVGRVDWMERYWGPADTSQCWEIAVGVLPEHRGKGIGAQAQQQLLDYIFAHTRAERIQATAHPDNKPEIRCLEKAGMSLEGRIRRAQWRDGRWHDQLLFSILRQEHETNRR